MLSRNVYTWILALYPIIEFYCFSIGSFFLNVGNAIIIFFSLIGIIRCIWNRKILTTKIDKILFVFLFYTLMISIINLMSSHGNESFDVVVKYVHIVCFFCVIFLSRTYIFDINESVKSFSLVAVVTSFAIITQFFLYKLFGKVFYFVPEAYRTDITNDISRPSGFFLEPSHFSIYCSFPLFLILFKSCSEMKYWCAMIISVAIIISQSSIGYVLLSVIMFGYILTHFKKKIAFEFIRKIVFIGIPTTVFVIILLVNYNIAEFVINHITEIDASSISSGNLRLLRGFSIWFQESLLQKIFGVGFANVKEFLIHNEIKTVYDGALPLGTEYMSSLSFILVMNGIIGFLLYLCAVSFAYKRVTKSDKILIMLFVIQLMSSEEFMKIGFLTIWIYILLSIEEKECNRSFIK